MADVQSEAQTAILERIAEKAKTAPNGAELAHLAEAYAWVVTPNNAH